MRTKVRIRIRLITALLVASVTLLCLFATGVASAAPIEPTIGLIQLDAMIEAAPGTVLHGYMKTVMRGSTIEQIPVDVLAITSDSVTSVGRTTLILIEATGPRIDKAGGIVSGMSGSPIYVSDGGVDKLIGAVSYSSSFTLGGTGLATPIEQMSQIESDYPFAPLAASSAGRLKAAGGPGGTVVVTLDDATSRRLGMRTFVAKPLFALQAGGLRGDDPAFLQYRAFMQKRGIDVIPSVTGLASGDPSFSVPLEAGAAVGAMASRGSFWSGGVGTVTYAYANTVLAFGHPAFWEGESGLEMTNAWIDGVWPSLDEPYKIARVGALRGTITQDRGAGILGRLGVMPSESTITARAVNLDTGRVGTSTSWMPRFAINSSSYNYAGIPSLAAYTAAATIFDSYKVGGSAVTTTTVVVSDGAQTFTILRRNVFDSSQDITTDLVDDVSEIVAAFQDVNTNGLAKADILSVDLQSEITASRNTAQIVDVEAPSGLVWGPNPVRLSLLEYGVAATRTIDTTLNIPVGTSLQGKLRAVPASAAASDSDESASSMFDPYLDSVDRRTVEELVGTLRAEAPNSDLAVVYTPTNPFDMPDPFDLYDGFSMASLASAALLEPDPYASATQTVPTTMYLTGSAEKSTTKATAIVSPRVVAYNGTAKVSGSITGLFQPATVQILTRAAGATTDTVLGRVAVTAGASAATFKATLAGLKKNTLVTVRFDGDDSSLPSRTSVRVQVAAAVGLRSSTTRVRRGRAVTLTATILPPSAGGSVAFQRRNGARWVAIGTRALSPIGTASISWKPPAGETKVRARYLGGATNAGGSSTSLTITAR